MKYEWMIDDISSFLFGYLKDGIIKIDTVFQKANGSIDGLQQLLLLRFIKNEQTIAFMKLLEHGLSTIKSTTTTNRQESYFEVRGEIDWQETLQRRSQTNVKDRFHFMVRETERTFDTDENLVLKELLKKLYGYCFDDSFLGRFQERSWYANVMHNRKHVAHTYLHNAYVSKVKLKRVSDRTIEKVKSHRKPIYREAANLLAQIRKIEREDFTELQLQEVLTEFFILPSNEDVLFELYWIVQLLKQQKGVTFYLMDGTSTKVASWSVGEVDVHLYHNSTGSGRVKFYVSRDELTNCENPFVTQKIASFDQYNKLAKAVFNEQKLNALWRGRPDILVEKINRHTNELEEVVIGEIKNTVSTSYASQGLKELLDYMHFMKVNNNCYGMTTALEVRGLLCLGDIPLSTFEVDNVQIVSLQNNWL